MGCLHSTSNFRLIEQKVGDKTTTISSIAAADVTEATGNVTITVTYGSYYSRWRRRRRR
ncbi:hypothetical protein IMAU30156_00981 [Lactobacillus helveticus]|nr:hypothetical protein [Lactobacillus helveticus]NRO36727.1 hypothetical protein [Lactobacillus helveticus]NRO54525.1 hypothetical protein [Lactobacillus helveticus]